MRIMLLYFLFILLIILSQWKSRLSRNCIVKFWRFPLNKKHDGLVEHYRSHIAFLSFLPKCSTQFYNNIAIFTQYTTKREIFQSRWNFYSHNETFPTTMKLFSQEKFHCNCYKYCKWVGLSPLTSTFVEWILIQWN